MRAIFRHFTLYNLEHEISIDFPAGVFCLAGANGLGKSTFLASLNYALTGIVPDPQREFKSAKEYYDYSGEFSDERRIEREMLARTSQAFQRWLDGNSS